MSHEQEQIADDDFRQRYMIIFDPDFLRLAIAVDRGMKQGWQPCGGLAVDKNYFYQAMILSAQS